MTTETLLPCANSRVKITESCRDIKRIIHRQGAPDMEYLFECSTRYLMSEHSERASYKVEHEKRYSTSTSNHACFDPFPNISACFPKIP